MTWWPCASAWRPTTASRPNQLIVTAGSTNLLDILARTLLVPGLNAVSSERSFIIYPIVTRSAGAEFRQVPCSQ